MTPEAESTLTIWARALTNEILALHVESMAKNIRFYRPDERQALLLEASSRLGKL